MLRKVHRRRSHGTLSPHHLGSVHRHAVPYSTRRELRRYNVPGRERAALAAWGRWVRRVRLALRTLGAQGTLPAQGLASAPDMTFFIHCALRALIHYSFVASRTSLRPCLWRGASPVGRVRSTAFLSIL